MQLPRVEYFKKMADVLCEDVYFAVAINQWGVYPGRLQKFINKLGTERVRGHVQEVGRKKGIARRGVYLCTVLSRITS